MKPHDEIREDIEGIIRQIDRVLDNDAVYELSEVITNYIEDKEWEN